MTEQSDRVTHWLHQTAVPPKVIDAISKMLSPAESLDVVDGELLVFGNEGVSQLASARFPDMADLLAKGSIKTALQLHLEGRPLPKYHAPEQRQAEQTFDAKQAIANSMLLTRVSAANV